VIPDAIIVQQPFIGRTRLSDLYSEKREKLYRPVYNKGRVLPDLLAAPFEFRDTLDSQNFQQPPNMPLDEDQPCCSNTII